MLNKTKTALVIAPHQDDEIIGCGGTICQMIDKRYIVKVAHVFLGTSGVPGCSPHVSAKKRHQEAVAAGKNGGYEVLENLGFVDRDRANDDLVQQRIIKLIRSVRPNILFAPHSKESDHEHQIVSLATREAVWLSATDIFPDLGSPLGYIPRTLYYEVWKNIDRPAIISDITSYQDRKRSMLENFPTQMTQTSWVDGALGRNQYRGTTTIGHGSVEVFECEGISLEEVI